MDSELLLLHRRQRVFGYSDAIHRGAKGTLRRRFIPRLKRWAFSPSYCKLCAAQIPYIREYRAGAKKRPDFLLGRVALELKTGGTLFDALRQLKRYAEADFSEGVILMTTRRFVIPSVLSGKPVHVVNLWQNLI